MRYFTAREATTTAEPPEPFTFQHSLFIIYKQNIQEFVGPAVRLSVCSVSSVDSSFVFIRVHSWFLINGLPFPCHAALMLEIRQRDAQAGQQETRAKQAVRKTRPPCVENLAQHHGA